MPRPETVRFHAVVDAQHDTSSGPSGAAPIYRRIADALASAPNDSSDFRIRVRPGRYREKLTIARPNVELIGDDRALCVLTYDAAAGQIAPDGQPWGTWHCASVTVRAPGFRARHLTIENAFDYVGHLRHPVLETVGSNGAQGVALMFDAGADRALLHDVAIVGHQDTLFVDAGRHLFEGCCITGSVDFVFGAGRAWFERCELRSRYRPGKERQGYVAVPSTLGRDDHGLVFHACELTREAHVADASVALGRPWRPTRHHADGDYGDPAVRGSAVFLRCWMDAHIDPAGWDAMRYTARDGTRQSFEPALARLGEYESQGPGAAVNTARPQLDAGQARACTRAAVLQE